MTSYGTHPLSLERHLGSESSLHVAVLLRSVKPFYEGSGLILISAAGLDILLVTPKDAPVSVPQCRLISGVFDTSFLGRALKTLCGCYHLVGRQPVSFGFHLYRYTRIRGIRSSR